MTKEIHKSPIRINYDKEADVMYIALGTDEVSYCKPVNNFVLLELGMQTNQPTGVRIIDFEKRKIKDKMWLSYKPNAIYFELKDGKVARTEEFVPEVFLDFDEADNLLGIKFLNAIGTLAQTICWVGDKPKW